MPPHSSPFYHLFTHTGNLILQKCFSVLHADQSVMSHAVDCIYLKSAPLFHCTLLSTAANTCCSVHKTLRSPHSLTYHVSVLWIMSSTGLPPLPHITHHLPPSPLQSPLIKIFHIVNHLCQLLVIIDN